MTWYLPSSPDNFEPTPWLHPAAVAYLETLVTRDMVVFEHGCGGSTLWFAKRAGEVHSYENNQAWHEAVSKKIKAQENVFVHLNGEPPTFSGFVCDLLFIDGWNNDRVLWIDAAEMLVKKGGIVVVDNANRPQYKDALQRLAELCTMPTIITAWTPQGKRVDTLFYRLKGGAEWI